MIDNVIRVVTVAAVAAIAPLAFVIARPQPAIAPPARSPVSVAAPPATMQPAAAPPTSPSATTVDVHSIPLTLAIPRLNSRSQIVEVGLDENKGVAVPDDPLVIGWYNESADLSAPTGSMVLVGHRNSRVYGAGSLEWLETLQIGDFIYVMGTHHTAVKFSVTNVQSVLKTSFTDIVAEAFSNKGGFRLTIITCGGEFDYSTGHYLSNIVVTAVPSN